MLLADVQLCIAGASNMAQLNAQHAALTPPRHMPACCRPEMQDSSNTDLMLDKLRATATDLFWALQQPVQQGEWCGGGCGTQVHAKYLQVNVVLLCHVPWH